MTMANVVTRASSSPIDFALKNNTYAEMSANLKALDFGIETDTGLFAGKDHGGTYRRCAPKSTLTAYYVPVCKTAATGELENSVIINNATSVTINNGQADIDVRIASDTEANLLFCDAGNSRIGIGTNTPAAKLDIYGAGNQNLLLRVSDDNVPQLQLIGNNKGWNFSKRRVADRDILNLYAITSYSGSTQTAALMTWDPNGNVGINTTTPAAKLDIYNVKTSTPNYLNLLLEDHAHGMTTIAPTNVPGLLKLSNTSGYAEGGLRVIGFSTSACSTSVPALSLEGYLGDADPVDSRQAIKLIAAKKNGTGAQALASTETVLELFNYTTSLVSITGNGNTNFKSSVNLSTSGTTLSINCNNEPAGSSYRKILLYDTVNSLYGYIGAYYGSGNGITFGFAASEGGVVTPEFSVTGDYGVWIDKAIRVNAGMGDYDSYLQDDAGGYLTWWDAGNARVGIGNALPSVKLDVTGDIKASGFVQVATVQRFWDLGGNQLLSNNLYYDSGFKYLTSSTASAITLTSTGNVTIGVYPSGTANDAATPITALSIANATGDATFANYVQAKYKSSDGTAGVSGSGSTITVKDGIVTAIS